MSYPTATIKSTTTTTLVIFDSQVTDLPLLYTALLPGSIAHTIKPDQDPIDQITHLLTQTGATKLAIVAHGQPGAIQIGNGKIDRAVLEARSGLLQEWGVDSIGLYACEVGADKGFIQRLGELTGANVSASTGKVGAGKWELDGGMELLSIDRLVDYSDTLAIFNGTAGGDFADQGLPPGIPASITGFTAGFSSLDLLLLTDGVDDTFNGGNGNDVVGAGTGDDILYGDAGNDTLGGGNGNDIINGGAGNNLLLGGAGNDRINADMGDQIYGGADNDFLYIFTAVNGVNYNVTFTGANAGTLSTNGTQTGSFNDIEQLYFGGYDGADTVDASLANLSITTPGTGFAALELNGFRGNDTLIGSAGNDTIIGGNDNDTITGNAGSNILNGDAGDDRINADYMRDTVDGGTGNDFLYIFTQVPTDANTVIFTGANAGKFQINGVDTGTFTEIEQLRFFGYEGNDTINANLANLSVTIPGTAAGFGTFGLNINTYSGNDIVLGSSGKDIILGGFGDDALYGQGGDDTIVGDEIFSSSGFDTIFGGAGIDTLSGGGLNDFIFGGTENDIINGDDGEDYLYGEDGDDNIKGGYGFDVIYGLAGNDTIYGEGITVDAFGFDTTVAPAAGVGINDTIFGGLGGDTIDGGIGDDVLLGEEGTDRIIGGAGNDFVYGGIGDDFLYGGGGNDYIVGQDGNDTLYGGDGIDYLEGGDGIDYLYGGDQFNLLVDNSADYLYGNAGNDFLFGQAGDDFLDGGDGNDLLNGGDGIDVLFGVEGNDILYGFAGVDYLYGGNGTDTLYGYAGSDFLIGGADSDTFGYAAMADAGDTITDFDPSVDKLSFTILFAGLTPIVLPSAAVTTDYLRFVQFGTSTLVQIDPNGLSPGPTYTTMATLNNVTASSLIPTINVLV